MYPKCLRIASKLKSNIVMEKHFVHKSYGPFAVLYFALYKSNFLFCSVVLLSLVAEPRFSALSSTPRQGKLHGTRKLLMVPPHALVW